MHEVFKGGPATFAPGPEAIQARFIAARRRGTPQWLWPHISAHDCRAAICMFEQAASRILTSERVLEPIDGDPEVVGIAGYLSGMGPLVAYWIEQGALRASPAVTEVLKLHLRHNRARNIRMQKEAREIVRLFAEHRIDAIILKGMHTAWAYFPDPGTRPVSDIDLLVNAAQADTANALLAANGFHQCGPRSYKETTWRANGSPDLPQTLSLVHVDDPWAVDLHHSINARPGEIKPYAMLDIALDQFPDMQRAPWLDAYALAQPMLLLHLATHSSLSFENLTLLRLVELVSVIRKDIADNRLDWREFLDAAERASATGLACPALYYAELLSPGTVPNFVLAKCEEAATPTVMKLLRRYTPATVQRLERYSMEEHFMWTRGRLGPARRVLSRLAPAGRSPSELFYHYGTFARRLLAGGISR